jgi:DNA polymerase-3 subunit delta
VAAVVSDASALGLDDIVDAAFAGRPAELETQLAKARTAGTSVGSILFASQRQVAQLHKWKTAIEGGASSSFDSLMPPPNFRRRAHVEAALRLWSAARLLTAMTELADAVLLSRRSGDLGSTIAERALLAIAANARRSAA